MCFEVLKNVLDNAYQRIPSAAKDQVIVQRLAELSAIYAQMEAQPELVERIDYNDPITRFAYLFRYVACHAALVSDLIQTSSPLRTHFQTRKLLVSCLGGGPGSEVLGIAKYLSTPDAVRPERMHAWLLDKHDIWSEAWSDIWAEQWPDTVPTKFTSTYLALDVTNPTQWRLRERPLEADLFLMIYSLSEVAGRRSQAMPFFAHLAHAARPGAMLFYLDNSRPAFHSWLDDLLPIHGFYVRDEATQERVVVPPDEDKACFGEYLDRFGPPRLQGWVTWKVWEKSPNA